MDLRERMEERLQGWRLGRGQSAGGEGQDVPQPSPMPRGSKGVHGGPSLGSTRGVRTAMRHRVA